MAAWFWYAVVAAVLYGAHQIFTRLAADHIGEGFGGFIVEASAALSILIYLAILWVGGRWNQKFSAAGLNYSLLTGICVGLERSRSSCCFKKAVRSLRFQRSSPVVRPSWPLQASCFSAKHHHGSESLALRSPSSVCFCYANRIGFRSCQTQGLAWNSAHRFNGPYDLRAIFWPFVPLLPFSR